MKLSLIFSVVLFSFFVIIKFPSKRQLWMFGSNLWGDVIFSVCNAISHAILQPLIVYIHVFSVE